MKYLNGVLTVIALCLVLITLAVTGLIPTASARESKGISNNKFATIPLNSDGSITVKFSPTETLDVNIDEVNGYSIGTTSLPVEIKNN